MGRLWQTLILSRWHPIFAYIPVESLVHAHQQDYYTALNNSTQQSDSSPFIEFMLKMVLNAILGAQSDTVLSALALGPLSANELVSHLNLRNKTGAFKRTMKDLIDQDLIEYTLPDKPNSRLQKYRLTNKGQILLDAKQEQSTQPLLK